MTRLPWVCIKHAVEGRFVRSHHPLRGRLGDAPTKWDALPLESFMLPSARRPHAGPNPLRSANVPAGNARPPRLRWMNFSRCPHCIANGRPGMPERINDWGIMISRSDGKKSHLILGDRPIEYPAVRTSGKTEMMSAEFWYVHEGNGGSTETVVVILRRLAGGGITLLRDLETVADKLFEKLRKSSRLSPLYEFDGKHLHQLVP